MLVYYSNGNKTPWHLLNDHVCIKILIIIHQLSWKKETRLQALICRGMLTPRCDLSSSSFFLDHFVAIIHSQLKATCGLERLFCSEHLICFLLQSLKS